MKQCFLLCYMGVCPHGMARPLVADGGKGGL